MNMETHTQTHMHTHTYTHTHACMHTHTHTHRETHTHTHTHREKNACMYKINITAEQMKINTTFKELKFLKLKMSPVSCSITNTCTHMHNTHHIRVA